MVGVDTNCAEWSFHNPIIGTDFTATSCSGLGYIHSSIVAMAARTFDCYQRILDDDVGWNDLAQICRMDFPRTYYLLLLRHE